MRRHYQFVIAACCAVASLVASAAPISTAASVQAARRAMLATPATPAVRSVDLPRLSAEQIVDRNVAARGGAAAWQRIDSIRMTGKLDAGKVRKDGGNIPSVGRLPRAQARAEARKALLAKAESPAQTIQLPFQLDLKRPLKMRLEIPFQGDTAVQVFDGANGWKLRPFLGRRDVEPYSADEMKIAASQQPLDGPLINHAAKGTAVDVVGGEIVDGRSAYKLRLKFKNGEVRHLWVDAQTFLDLKIEGAPRRWDGKTRMVATYLRDYKSVDGVMIPHRLATVVEGTPVSDTIYVERVALNPSIDDARFAKPQ